MKLDEVIQQPGMKERALIEAIMQRLHVATPGIVMKYNEEAHTVDVQPAIRQPHSTERPPMLLDVPVFYPGGKYFRIAKGEECLVVFADQCIDGWYEGGGVLSPALSRRHDMSDGFALVGFFSSRKDPEEEQGVIPIPKHFTWGDLYPESKEDD